MNLAILIPIYKIIPDGNEIISLRQCLNTLLLYDIFFVCPEDLELDAYYKIISENRRKGQAVSIARFPCVFFNSIHGYNRLMLDENFYKEFIRYRYVLICQLDTYIFKDDLIQWCSKDYDYVGAPWINWSWSEHHAKFMTLPRKVLTKLGYTKYNLVGNGGFSLRKTSSFIQNLSFFGKRANLFSHNEDYFFSFYITSYNPFFRIPPVKEALSFAFDENPEEAYFLNNGQLPMACHAWPKYINFWRQFINTNIQ